MRLLLAANNQATRRNEIIKSYLQLGSSSNRYAPRLPQQEQNHLQNSFLRRAQFWVRKTFSKPASLKRASLVALPAAISHKASLKPKRCASATLIQKTSKNEPKHGPKNGTAWRSHFWDRMRRLQCSTTQATSGGTKMRPQNRKLNGKLRYSVVRLNSITQLRLIEQRYRNRWRSTEEARTCEA